MNYDDSILSDYNDEASLYEALSIKISVLLEEAVKKEGLYVHSIHNRVKERDSLSRKLNRPEVSYKKLGDMTDIAGVRVITYFNADVEHVADIVQREFSIDSKNCVDKATLLDPDRFGYLSLHYVVGLR